MKVVIAYVSRFRAAAVLRAFYDAGLTGVTAYPVHGTSGEASTFLYSNHPFEPAHLPESVKIEMVCSEERIEQILNILAREAKTGQPGDGLVVIQDIERLMRIRDLSAEGSV